MNISYRRLTILCIKYGPTLLAFSCAAKVWLICMAGGFDTAPLIKAVSYINLITSLLILMLFYAAGEVFNFCWKHKSLCRLTFIGYVYFFLALTFNFSSCYEIKVLSIWYVAIVLIISLIYKFTNENTIKRGN